MASDVDLMLFGQYTCEHFSSQRTRCSLAPKARDANKSPRLGWAVPHKLNMLTLKWLGTFSKCPV